MTTKAKRDHEAQAIRAIVPVLNHDEVYVILCALETYSRTIEAMDHTMHGTPEMRADGARAADLSKLFARANAARDFLEGQQS